MSEEKKYPCPCCGSLTLSEPPPGTFDICDVCDWEDDRVQYDEPGLDEGANHVSLREARENYRKYGIADPRCWAYLPERAPANWREIVARFKAERGSDEDPYSS